MKGKSSALVTRLLVLCLIGWHQLLQTASASGQDKNLIDQSKLSEQTAEDEAESVPDEEESSPSVQPLTPSPTPEKTWECIPEAFKASIKAPLANVYQPERLTLIRPCLTVKGTVVSAKPSKKLLSDGDHHIKLKLFPEYESLLNKRNIEAQGGNLVLEMVPADQEECTPSKLSQIPSLVLAGLDTQCSQRRLRMPEVGQSIQVSGPYVLDTVHGWMELHPIWQWSALP